MAQDKQIVHMDIYPCMDRYVCKFKAPSVQASGQPKKSKSTINGNNSISTKVVLDISGSMGSNVEYLTNLILPQVFTNLGYSNHDEIHLLTFESKLDEFRCNIETMPTLGLRARGGTSMSPAVKRLADDIHQSQPKNLRILTISDGELSDQEQTVGASDQLASTLSSIRVNSRAIRFFTSHSHPDTRGLASVIRWSTLNASNDKPADSQLIDIQSGDPIEIIVATIVSLFDSDGLEMNMMLRANDTTTMMSHAPWTMATDTLIINPGENIIWLNQLPMDGSLMFVDMPNVTITYHQHEALTYDSASTILTTKLDMFKYRMKVLKILHTPNAREEFQKMMMYFEKLTTWFDSIEVQNSIDPNVSPTSLRTRLDYTRALVKKRTKTIFNEFRQIANVDNVDKFNAAQQADYLRCTDVTRNSKGLARRVIDHGLDFSQTTRNEVRQMREHIAELDGLDDKNHTISFYSLETTLGGIRAICQLTDTELDSLEAAEILPILNVVGTACNAQIGDYPDAMTWRPNEVIAGCTVSVADLLAHRLQSGIDEDLLAPGTRQPITNVLPTFDDPQIQRFLQKYAPNILEYLASVGMRRMIGNVPLTYAYTLAGGIWKMIEFLDTNKSEVNIVTFLKLVNAYELASEYKFSHIIKAILANHMNPNSSDNGKLYSFYILNNGLTNMINPLMYFIKQKKVSTETLQAILRAIYAYEVYQGMRRLYKYEEQPAAASAKMTIDLIGIDLDKYSLDVGPLFETRMDPVFYDQWHLDHQVFDRIDQAIYYVKYIGLVPLYLEAAYASDPINVVKKIPSLTDDVFCASLGVSYSLEEFKFFTMLQGLLFNSKSLRVHAEEPQMLILDTGHRDQAEHMTHEYIRKQYANHYESGMKVKREKERQIIVNELVDLLINSQSINEFSQLLSSGIERHSIKLAIENSSSIGFMMLKNALLDMDVQVPLRLAKLSIFLLGRNEAGEEIWNRGGVLFVNLAEFKNVIVGKMNESAFWDKLMAEYQLRCIHIYRGDATKANRHGHSNDKPSFWARGFPSLLAMKEAISKSDWAAYIEQHPTCCGVDKMDLMKI